MRVGFLGDYHERDACPRSAAGRSGHGREAGLGLDRIKKVARVDEHVGLLPDDESVAARKLS